MATVPLLSAAEAAPAAQAVFAEIRAARGVPDVNNFWKALAHDPTQLRRVWDQAQAVMAPGTLDPLTKELIYLAVSLTNGCSYCVHSHTAAARQKGLTPAQYHEFLTVVGMAQQTNALASALGVPVDPAFEAAAAPAQPHPGP
jgi:AhpD family alkylhydroperoxidase